MLCAPAAVTHPSSTPAPLLRPPLPCRSTSGLLGLGEDLEDTGVGGVGGGLGGAMDLGP